MEISIYSATQPLFPKNFKNFIYIKTVQDSTQNCTLADAIGKTKTFGEDPVPTYVCILEGVDEDVCAKEDSGETALIELSEE